METVYEPGRDIPVHTTADVLVVGSGPAGMSAAIAAARESVDVVLVERYGCFGGVISHVGVGGIAWYRKEQTVEADGLLAEYERRSIVLDGLTPEPQSTSQALDAESFKVICDQMITEANIRPLLHCTAVSAIVENNIVKGVITESKMGRRAILAKVVIDCTGDGDIAYFAGVPFHKREKTMHVTTMFHCSGVDTARFCDYFYNDLKPTYDSWNGYWSVKTTGKENSLPSSFIGGPIHEAVISGIIPQENDVGLGGGFKIITGNGEVLQLNLVFIDGINPLDTNDLTRGEIVGRRNALYCIEALRAKVPGFEHAKLRNFGMTLGIRESRRIKARYRLCESDVREQGRFEDSIGIMPEFIDGEGWLVLPTTGRYYQLPYSCIVPNTVDNLLVAGRCLCADDIGFASTRNMCGCVVSGQGAGVAAAVAIGGNCSTRNVDIHKVQKALESQDVRVF